MDKSKIITLLSIFLILNFLDLILTVSAISEGKGHEVNPIMAYLLENSTLMFTAVKIAGGLVVAFLMYKLRHVRIGRIATVLLVVAYIFIVANNAVIIAKADVTVQESGVVNIQVCGNAYEVYRGVTNYGGGACYALFQWLYLDFSKYPQIQSVDFYYRVYTESTYDNNVNTGTKAEYAITLFENNNFLTFIDDKSGAFGMPIKLTRNGYDVVEGQLYVYPDINNIGYYHIKVVFDISTYNKSNIVYSPAVYNIEYPSGWDIRLYIDNQPVTDDPAVNTPDYPALVFKHCSFSNRFELAEYNNATINYCTEQIADNYNYTYAYNTTTGIEEGWLNVTKTGANSMWKIYFKSYLTGETYFQEIDTTLNTDPFNWRLAGYLINATVYYTSTNYQVVTFTQPNFSTAPPPPSGTSTVTFYFIDSKTSALIDNVNFTLKETLFGNSTILNGTYDYSVTASNLNDLEVYSYTASRTGYVTVNGNVYYPPSGKETTVYVYMTPIEQPSDANNSIVAFNVVTDFLGIEIPLANAVVTLNGETKLTNDNGYVSFEVAKNNTYSYLVSKDGYFSKAGEITPTQDYHTVKVVLETTVPQTTPTPTATPTTTAGGTGGSGTSTGYTADEGLRQAARDTLTNYYQIVPGFFGLVFLLFFMATLNGVWRRRR